LNCCAVLNNILDAERLEFRKSLKDGTRYVSTMKDRIDESNNEPIVDSRANLFLFLQKLANELQAGAMTCKNAETSIPDEQLAASKRNKGMI
jgi:hypothetical protein